ncbi:MAG: acyl-CoA thioesterase [Deltaproteobacteria bacterium]|nr:acyl-CoA thioesterase [Deltaproteobacteria bacterium]
MAHLGPGRQFEHRLIAPLSDNDENSHVSNIAYVRWIQEAAFAHAEASGWGAARYITLGCSFVIRRHEIDYVRSAKGGDPIKVLTWVEEFRPASATRITRILRANDDVELVRASTEWVWVTLATLRPTRMPADVAAAFR